MYSTRLVQALKPGLDWYRSMLDGAVSTSKENGKMGSKLKHMLKLVLAMVSGLNSFSLLTLMELIQ